MLKCFDTPSNTKEIQLLAPNQIVQNDSRDEQLKIVVVGNINVGKSCYIAALFELKKEQRSSLADICRLTVATIGLDYLSLMFDLPNKQNAKVQIWDTAGLERYHALNKQYYNNASGAIICFDLTQAIDLKKIEYWVNEVESAESSCKFMIVGTKSDLEVNIHTVDILEKYCSTNGHQFFQTSSMNGENVVDSFQYFINRLAASSRRTHLAKSAIMLKSSQIESRIGLEGKVKATKGNNNCCN